MLIALGFGIFQLVEIGAAAASHAELFAIAAAGYAVLGLSMIGGRTHAG